MTEKKKKDDVPRWQGCLAFAITVFVCVVVLVSVLNAMYPPVHGEKLEEGVRVVQGTITRMSSVHGGDWSMKLDTSPHIFEFEYGTFGFDNHPHVGENILIAYEWKILWHTSGVISDEDDSDYFRYWAPLVLDWEVLLR